MESIINLQQLFITRRNITQAINNEGILYFVIIPLKTDL